MILHLDHIDFLTTDKEMIFIQKGCLHEQTNMLYINTGGVTNGKGVSIMQVK